MPMKKKCTRETFWDGRATPCLNLTLFGRVTDVAQKVWRLKQMWQRRKEDRSSRNRRRKGLYGCYLECSSLICSRAKRVIVHSKEGEMRGNIDGGMDPGAATQRRMER